MAYKVVLKDDETSVDFDASGEELLIVRHVGADVTLFLLYPDGRGAETLRTFTKSDNQRLRAPKGTRLRLGDKHKRVQLHGLVKSMLMVQVICYEYTGRRTPYRR